MNKKGFTLIELLVVISIIAVLSTSVMTTLNSARTSGRDSVRVSDIQQLSLAMELNRNIYTDDYQTISNTTPQAVGSDLPEVPENNLENSGVYGWIDNTSDPDIYCAWAVLEENTFGGTYYVSTPRGAGYMDDEPTDFDSCVFYEEQSYDTGNENLNKKTFLCHTNKKGKQKTLNVGNGAVSNHLGHGDTLGECS